MAKFKNVSPLGALDISAIGRVEAGEVFEVPDDLVDAFAGQDGTFKRVGGPAPKAAKTKQKTEGEGGEDDDAA